MLQELYAEQPTLPPATAVSHIQGLQTVLSSGSSAVSTDTLTVMGGNERALAQVTDHAGHRLTLPIKLPAATLQALANKTSESASFTLTAVTSTGTSKATAAIAKLMPR